MHRSPGGAIRRCTYGLLENPKNNRKFLRMEKSKNRVRPKKGSKYQKHWDFYNAYLFQKCSPELYRHRIGRWMNIELAVLPTHANAVRAIHINDEWRECTTCGNFKYWFQFPKCSLWLNGHTSNCRNCRNNLSRKFRENTEHDHPEKCSEKRYEKSPDTEERRMLDSLFDNDKVMISNRAIILRFRKISEEEEFKNKIYFLMNLGYSIEFLEKIYDRDINTRLIPQLRRRKEK